MEPKITTNSYQFRASEFAALYAGYLFRKFWFIFLPILGIILGTLIYDTIKNPSLFSLIPFGMFTLITIRARYQFIRKLKNSPGFDRLRTTKVYEHCIEVEDNLGNERAFFLVDIEKVVLLRKHYHVNLKNKQTFWIPKDYFKTPEDEILFEGHLREKGKMK